MRIKTRVFRLRLLFSVFCFVLSLLFYFSLLPFPALMAQESREIEIVIRDSTFEFMGEVVSPNEPITIILRNLDAQQHGFTSEVFPEIRLKIESESGVVFGKGIRGVHINAGEVMRISFTPINTGRYTFSCDLHPVEQGELPSFSVRTA